MSKVQQLLTENLDIWTSAETEKKSGRGRASGSAGKVYGIQKLRGLILDLAVRGKLVPQDPNDEPASELLKRIHAEKAKLIAEDKLKKDKLLVAITDDEKPFELPSGWEWAHLPDVTDYKVGKTPSTKSSDYWTDSNNGIKWVSIADLNHYGVVTETTKKVTELAQKEVFKSELVPVGTILMSFKLTLGKVSILAVPAFHNEAIISIYPSQAIDKSYLFKILPARANEGDSKSAIKGNTLNSESIAALLLPLPPLAEQHRIVAKVDELMALCDQLEQQHSNAAEAHEKLVEHLLGTLSQAPNAQEFNSQWQRIYAHFDTLFTTEASIDALKQTLLQLAVMGKLVPQDPNDESASELLKRIQAEKAKLIAEGKLKKDKPLALIAEKEPPFELPNGWKWQKLTEVILKITDGEHLSPQKTTEGMPLVSAKDVKADGVDLTETNFVKYEDGISFRQRCNPEYNDILICSRGTIGRCALVNTNEIFCMMGSVILLKTSRALNANYLTRYLQTTIAQSWMTGASSATAVSALYLKDVAKLLVPLPPIVEQSRIVAKLDEFMALCDQLKTRIQQASQHQQQLADVLVTQALI